MKTTAAGWRFVACVFAVLAATSATACIGGLGRPTDPFSEGPSAGTGSIQVEAQNSNFNDASLYAIRQGQRIRLGTVTGKSDQRFTLDWNFSVPLRFEVQLVGGGSCRVREIMVDPGDRLWVRIPTEVAITPCTVGKQR